jgi:hypothetical protein
MKEYASKSSEGGKEDKLHLLCKFPGLENKRTLEAEFCNLKEIKSMNNFLRKLSLALLQLFYGLYQLFSWEKLML